MYKTLRTDMALLREKASSNYLCVRKTIHFSWSRVVYKNHFVQAVCHLHCNKMVINVPEHVSER